MSLTLPRLLPETTSLDSDAGKWTHKEPSSLAEWKRQSLKFRETRQLEFAGESAQEEGAT